MAIKFQYNKTSLQMLEKQLKVRVRTLPIIKNKESALRMEVKRCKEEAVGLEEKLEQEIQAYEAMFALWNEFDSSLVKVKDVHLGVKKIAGVRVPILENVDFETRPFSLFASPKWYADAANAKTKMENGFDLTNYDERTLAFAKDYANQLLAIDVNLDTTEMLDVTWGLFGKYFKPEEVNIKKELVEEFWGK